MFLVFSTHFNIHLLSRLGYIIRGSTIPGIEQIVINIQIIVHLQTYTTSSATLFNHAYYSILSIFLKGNAIKCQIVYVIFNVTRELYLIVVLQFWYMFHNKGSKGIKKYNLNTHTNSDLPLRSEVETTRYSLLYLCCETNTRIAKPLRLTFDSHFQIIFFVYHIIFKIIEQQYHCFYQESNN